MKTGLPTDCMAFISHSSNDRDVAQQVCHYLEQHGIKCWIAPRDIPAGRSYDQQIVEAIDTCQVLLVIISNGAINSKHVEREVWLASERNTKIIPTRIEDVRLHGSLEYQVGRTQWIDLFPGPIDRHLPTLLAEFSQDAPIHEDRLDNASSEATTFRPGLSPRLATLVAIPMASVLLIVLLNFYFGRQGAVSEESAEQNRSSLHANGNAAAQSWNAKIIAHRLRDEANWMAVINDDSSEGRVIYENERARLEVDFDEVVYFMVLAYTPRADAGKLQLIWPEDDDRPPIAGDAFLLPRRSSEDTSIDLTDNANPLARRGKSWVFSDGAGLHSFVVISSRDPLPSFNQIKSQLAMAWTPAELDTKQWTIERGAAYVNEFILGSGSVLRGVDESDGVDLQPFVDSLQATLPDSQIDGLVFEVERSLE